MNSGIKKSRAKIYACSFFLIVSLIVSVQNVVAQYGNGVSTTNLKSLQLKPFYSSPEVKSQKINQGNLHIVAIMVEFQPDSNVYTSGNGLFNPSYLDTTSIVIDPLPHNQTYFEGHLKFVKHYFETVSKGKLSVSYEVVPTVYRLDEEMAYYSPTGPDNSNDHKLTWLTQETFEKMDADPTVSTVNWDSNTMFILFHAGAGRDFDFLNTTLDRTPQDIPSLYLSQNAIAQLMDEPGFQGYSVKGFSVKNVGILPETESRTGEFLDEPFVLQLAINGLVTAIVGNHIGLPDLYNTSDGTSGIGRFGLMDPEGFFAHFGLFPPYPSAWERYYMEWDTAREIDLRTDTDISLEAVSLNPVIGMAKASISADEYFLIENRHRNASNTGIELTIQEPDGNIITRNFTESDIKFSADNLDSLISVLPKGVIIAVNNYDWSLPGGLSAGNDGDYFTADDRILSGGFLIWHIDESVIRQGLLSNAINANTYRRGVDLEEADGAQDIGNSTNNLFLESVISGTSFDFWWSGNNYTVIDTFGDSLKAFENRFSVDTRPSTRSNSGATIPLEIYSFSDVLSTGSFKVKYVENGLKTDARFDDRRLGRLITQQSEENSYPLHPLIFTNGIDSSLIVPSKNGLFAVPFNSSTTNEFVELSASSYRQPIVYQNQLIVAVSQSEIESFSLNGNVWTSNWKIDLGEIITGSLSISNGLIDIERSLAYLNPLDGTLQVVLSKPTIESATVNGKKAILSESSILFDGKSYSAPSANSLESRLMLGLHSFGAKEVISLQTDHELYLIADEEYQVDVSGSLASIFYHPSNVDIQILSTEIDFIAQYPNRTQVSNYPVHAFGMEFIGTPLLVDLDGDGSQERIVMQKDSLQTRLMAFHANNEVVNGFPILIGSNQAFPPLSPFFDAKRLWIVTTDGFIYSWYFPQSGESQWKSPYGNRKDGKLSSLVTNPKTYSPGSSLLLKSETYNWPNPSNQETTIRYQATEVSDISIDIYTLDGLKIWSRALSTLGKYPEEIKLNTNSWGNGLYYIRLQAKSTSKTESKIIKLVVEH